jgi:uncharacterized protein (DUF2235 family)
MPKNIIICLDGTGNEITDNLSNVLKIYRSLRRNKDQLVYYTQGVGTLAEFRLWKKVKQAIFDKFLGKTLGYGLDSRVTNAYRFIVQNYKSGDEIFIFGYSRGAYTARVLAGMIHAIGILKPFQENLVGAAYAAYLSEPRLSPQDREELFDEEAIATTESLAKSFHRVTQSDFVPIRFMGLFDTVGSVFVPNFGSKQHWFFTRNPYPHTYFNPSVQTVRHAVSIDESRRMFPVSLWPRGQMYKSNPFDKDPAPQELDELWFSGKHGDVGGGTPRAASGLSQISLTWMLQGAKLSGLKIYDPMFKYVTGVKPLNKNTQYLYPKADATAKIHPSTKAWGFLELFPSRSSKVRFLPNQRSRLHFPLFRPRPIPQDAKIHDSVFTRIDGVGTYRPSNLPEKNKGEAF